MTLVTTSSHHTPAGNLTSGIASLLLRRLRTLVLRQQSCQNRLVNSRRGDKMATAIVGPPPTMPASVPPSTCVFRSNVITDSGGT